jgi:hypothetical protein
MRRARRAILSLALGALVLAALSVVAGHSLTAALDDLLDLRRLAQAEMRGHPLILALLLLQAVLIAIPFVPGAEIGFLLIALFGAPIAAQVYLATVAGLLLAFGAGRAVPPESAQRLLDRWRLGEAAAAVERLAQKAAAPPAADAPPLRRLAARLLRHRCLCLVLLINTPGNSLLGGGGGIAMAAGMSRLFTTRQFLASVLVAVAPVPVFVLLMAAWT